MAEFLASSLGYAVAGYEDRTDADYQRMTLLEHEIVLTINPAEPEHQELVRAMKRVLNSLSRGVTMPDDEFIEAYEAATRQAQSILKAEWNRVREGAQPGVVADARRPRARRAGSPCSVYAASRGAAERQAVRPSRISMERGRDVIVWASSLALLSIGSVGLGIWAGIVVQAIRARLAFGQWPSAETPDPIGLRDWLVQGQFEWVSTTLGTLAVFAGGLWLLERLSRGGRRVAYAGPISASVAVMWLVILSLDPGGLVHWWFD